MRNKLILFLILLLAPSLVGATTLKTEKHASLINVSRTSTSVSYTFTADRNQIFYYDADVYDQVTAVYVEAVMRDGNAADTAYMILSDLASTDVTGSGVTVTGTTSNIQARSGDIKANLTDNTAYRARWKCDNGAGGAPAGTCSYDVFRVIIVQQGQVTKTENVVELSEDNNIPSTSYGSLSFNFAIWKYDASMYDSTVQAFVEADLHPNASGNTIRARLYDITAGVAVASSEVSHTGDTTTTRKRSGAITLTDGHEYRPDVAGTSTSDDLVAFKIIVQQSGTPTKTANYISMLNTSTGGTETSYTEQNRNLMYGASSWDGDSEVFYYEATLQVNSNTGYSNIFNQTDATDISAISTSTTAYSRNRSASITLPSNEDNVLDHRRKIDTSGYLTVSRSFLIIQQTWSAPAVGGATQEDVIFFE